jgi:hypothetical protein
MLSAHRVAAAFGTDALLLMAQEIAAVKPEAVLRGADGYLRVHYGRLDLRLQTWDQWTAAH